MKCFAFMLGALVCLTSAVPSPFDVRALGAMDQQVRTLEARGLLERFPSCAQDAMMPTVKESGCEIDDVECLCNNPKIKEAATKKVLAACGMTKSMKLIPIVNELCGTDF